MSSYFDLFPLARYLIGRNVDTVNSYDLAVNLLVRVRVLTEQLDSIFHYYEYVIKDGESPEILADRLYRDPEAHWIILLTNNITDPLYDWPLFYDSFDKYIVNKYGSLSNAKTTIHHYNKIIKQIDFTTKTETIKKIRIEPNPISEIFVNVGGLGYSNGFLTFSTNFGIGANVSYTVNSFGSIVSTNVISGGSYIAAPNVTISGANTSIANITSFVATGNLWSSLPTDQGGVESYNVGTKVVNIYDGYRESVSNYDWEVEQNDAKRNIKIIKPEYYSAIKEEFKNIMARAGTNLTSRRRVI